MPIPSYESLMKPLLEAIADGRAHALSEIEERLAQHFHLTPEERSQRIPSGTQSLFYNRVGWARTYLKKAGLLTSPSRGFVQLTERGQAVLRENPAQIDNAFLMRFEAFRAFLEESRVSRGRHSDGEPEPEEVAPGSASTADERMAAAYAELRARLISDVLERVKSLTPQAFERLVVDVLVKLGYGGGNERAGQVVGRSGDEGIDGLIHQDPLGVDTIYIQAKRWDQSVGRPEVQKFVGALQGQRARKGIFIISSEFTKEARDYAERLETKVILIDGRRLAELMVDHGVGVATARSYEVKRLDSDYFAELEGIAE